MDTSEAKKIIEGYKDSIEVGTEGGTILRRSSLLPHSKGKIKYAYFLLIEDLITSNELNSDLKEDLISSYSLLNTFVDDLTVEKYSKIYNGWQAKKFDLNKNKKDESAIKQYLAFTHTLGTGDLNKEISDFIEELV